MSLKLFLPTLLISSTCLADPPGAPAYMYSAPAVSEPSAYYYGSTYKAPVVEPVKEPAAEPAKPLNGDDRMDNTKALEAECRKEWDNVVANCREQKSKTQDVLTEFMPASVNDTVAEGKRKQAVERCRTACQITQGQSIDSVKPLNKCVDYQNKMREGKRNYELSSLENEYTDRMRKVFDQCPYAGETIANAYVDKRIKDADEKLKEQLKGQGPDGRSYFTYTDMHRGQLRCANYPGQTSQIECVSMRDLQLVTTSETMIRNSDSTYIPSLEPVTETSSVIPIPIPKPACLVAGTCGGRDAGHGGEIVGGDDAGSTTSTPNPDPITEKPTVTPKPAESTPVAQQKATPEQQTAGLNGGANGGLSGGSSSGGSGGGNPFSPSPMNWGTSMASNTASDTNYNSGTSSMGASELTSGSSNSLGSGSPFESSSGGNRGNKSGGREASQLSASNMGSGGALGNSPSGIGGYPSARSSGKNAPGGLQVASRMPLLGGEKFYKASGSRAFGPAMSSQEKARLAALKGKKIKGLKSGICSDKDIPCQIKLMGMSDKKFKNLKAKYGERGLASFFKTKNKGNLPTEIGSGMHDAIAAAAAIVQKNMTLDDAGDLDYSPVDTSNN